MSGAQKDLEDQKTAIMAQIAELSRLLGMTPADGAVELHEPMTDRRMALSDWLDTTRNSFLKLSTLTSKALEVQLQ